MTYTAQVHREGALWVIEVPGVGTTQSATLSQAEHMARSLIAELEGVGYETVSVAVDIHLPEAVSRSVAEVREATRQAQDLTTRAATLQRELVIELADVSHFSGGDIAAILGVTAARVSQIRKAAAGRGHAAGRGVAAAGREPDVAAAG